MGGLRRLPASVQSPARTRFRNSLDDDDLVRFSKRRFLSMLLAMIALGTTIALLLMLASQEDVSTTGSAARHASQQLASRQRPPGCSEAEDLVDCSSAVGVCSLGGVGDANVGQRDPSKNPLSFVADPLCCVSRNSRLVLAVADVQRAIDKEMLAKQLAHLADPSNRKTQLPFTWYNWEPTLACPYGIERAGRYRDGAKWVCGLRFMREPCVVYSLGSAGEDSFEEAVEEHSMCEIHTFDPTTEATAPEWDPHAANVKGRYWYHSVAVGDVDGLMTLRDGSGALLQCAFRWSVHETAVHAAFARSAHCCPPLYGDEAARPLQDRRAEG